MIFVVWHWSGWGFFPFPATKVYIAAALYVQVECAKLGFSHRVAVHSDRPAVRLILGWS